VSTVAVLGVAEFVAKLIVKYPSEVFACTGTRWFAEHNHSKAFKSKEELIGRIKEHGMVKLQESTVGLMI